MERVWPVVHPTFSILLHDNVAYAILMFNFAISVGRVVDISIILGALIIIDWFLLTYVNLMIQTIIMTI